ncbi:MAG: AmmeMemoRadiSam system radical SAM enzyme [Ignavibacteria bacterium]|nr:AmmeMemoRadiSam system radical SAM enzyme [Ignavibacteria bacterium]
MKEALLFECKDEETKEVVCKLCNHYCKISNNNSGICRVRFNHDGKLFSYSYGKVDGVAIDPIEKKPFYHFKPKAKVLSFGTPGCNFKCANCQNSYLSQSIKVKPEFLLFQEVVPPENIVKLAEKYKVDGISYTYSEPTIFFEYARDVIWNCKNNDATKDLVHMFVSNGYFSKEMLEIVKTENLLDAINIDLKFFDDQKYLKITGGHLRPVLESIEKVLALGIHLEVINLVIPGENDDDESFKNIANFISKLSKDIPLHFSRFYPQYKMTEKPPTPYSTLIRAKEIATSFGLNYVYIGNTDIQNAENTYCPKCKFLVVERKRYITNVNYVIENGKAKCPKCSEILPIVV